MINLGYHFFTAYNRAHSSNPNGISTFAYNKKKLIVVNLEKSGRKKR